MIDHFCCWKLTLIDDWLFRNLARCAKRNQNLGANPAIGTKILTLWGRILRILPTNMTLGDGV